MCRFTSSATGRNITMVMMMSCFLFVSTRLFNNIREQSENLTSYAHVTSKWHAASAQDQQPGVIINHTVPGEHDSIMPFLKRFGIYARYMFTVNN